MSLNPFSADPAFRAHIESLIASRGDEIRAAAEPLIEQGASALPANLGGVLPAEAVTALVDKFALRGPRDLMLVLLDRARDFAHPPISNFFVGAVGLEAETGNLVLGGNVEFPGTHLGFTLHGEGFVFTRAYSRGTSISTIAIGEAHPCAHCRQYLSEFAATRTLRLIDPLGHDLSMSQLYPWPFDPDYLGEQGAVPGKVNWPDLRLSADLSDTIIARLLETGSRAHAPYSKAPAALVLELADGNMVTGLPIESVAFNPTIQPVQSALVDLLAHGYDYAAITRATLATTSGGPVDYGRSTAKLLGSVAPHAHFTHVEWTGQGD